VLRVRAQQSINSTSLIDEQLSLAASISFR